MSESAIREGVRALRHGGPGVAMELLSRAYYTYGRRTDGDVVLERDWDVLVVLDACRADLMAAVADDHAWLRTEGPIQSVGATSSEWLTETFGSVPTGALDEIGYVTGNPYSAEHVDHDAFAFVDEVWEYGWDDDLGTVPARPITDRAVAAGRERDAERLVVHYMQPHFPSVPRGEGDGIPLERFGRESLSVWEELRYGWRDRADVWAAYIENLEYVLDEVRLLTENIDAERVAVTADHGNALGERHLYGHVGGVSTPELREVPWCVTSASDTGDHRPTTHHATDGGAGEATDEAVAARLEALGYR
ncbi:hypothetical protein MBEHAL_2349 [Halarchaeum acidiphilum MH1-52-1]|uniref:Sulfatase N-terminal domain-containing protein n=1 Tax=Halarchaeum acidiphilum MH1-52-1 TaxID=1261545 RepID=U3A7C6_9EURY|nr:hypothetical protein [Halarchaeum acidiphilum]GAD53589.1 hypothetical protein MBEHAL_2349 [Halarchaeum acidiphilum MH1-52-1]